MSYYKNWRYLITLVLALTCLTANSQQENVTEMLLKAMNNQSLQEVSEIADRIENNRNNGAERTKKSIEYNKLGLAKLTENNLSDSIDYFKQASEDDPTNIEALNNLAFAYIKNKEFKSAEIVLNAVIAQSPTRSSAWFNIGEVFARQQNAELARNAFELAYHFSKNKQKTSSAINKLGESDNPYLQAAISKLSFLSNINTANTPTKEIISSVSEQESKNLSTSQSNEVSNELKPSIAEQPKQANSDIDNRSSSKFAEKIKSNNEFIETIFFYYFVASCLIGLINHKRVVYNTGYADLIGTAIIFGVTWTLVIVTSEWPGFGGWVATLIVIIIYCMALVLISKSANRDIRLAILGAVAKAPFSLLVALIFLWVGKNPREREEHLARELRLARNLGKSQGTARAEHRAEMHRQDSNQKMIKEYIIDKFVFNKDLVAANIQEGEIPQG